MKLDKKVEVFRAPRVDDGFQSRRGSMASIGSAWAAQAAVAAGEGQVMAQEAATMRCTFTFRAQGVGRQIAATDEVECDGVRWQVTGVEPIADRRFRTISAVARGPV